tara:strand:- start:1230 stop:2027 length:798 start_codon:yes stop_codon:yes gene_type:complete
MSFVLAQAEYQITTTPLNAKKLSLHNGFLALDNLSYNKASSLTFLYYPSDIKLLNYSFNQYEFSLLDYGKLEDKIDNQIFNSFNAYECLIRYNYGKKIKDLFFMNLSNGIILSNLGNYSSSAIIMDFDFKTKIDKIYILFSMNNMGFILDTYTNQDMKLPMFSQFSLKKEFEDYSIYFGYDNIYNFNIDKVEHVISIEGKINPNIEFRLSNSSYRTKLLIDDYNSDFFYGLALGLTINTNKNSSYDLGISSLGSAGYIYGITINY